MSTSSRTTDTRPTLIPTQTGVISVSLDTYTDRDGDVRQVIEVADAGATLFGLSPARARRLAWLLLRLADQTEPLQPEAFTAILRGVSEGLGTEVTLEEIANEAGVDLETGTAADHDALARVIGERMTGRRDVSVGPGGSTYELSEYAEQR